MRVNVAKKPAPAFNHEGTPVKHLNAELALRRTVMACMLWEDGFYENGQSVAERISTLVKQLPAAKVAEIAIQAREQQKLRHVPLWLARELARESQGRLLGDLLYTIIQRPDEINEFLALYWKDGKIPLAKQIKLGLARAYRKFNEYSLAKWNRDSAVTLRDALFMVHSKPKDSPARRYNAEDRRNGKRVRLTKDEQLYKRLTDDALETPDTWEVELSAGANKRDTFIRLLEENKLGALALLRNLRNMNEAGVPPGFIKAGLERMKVDRVLPFRFITAAQYAMNFEPELEAAMFRCLDDMDKLDGRTAIVIDTSPSMWQSKISAKSEMTRFDAAAALAILCREICTDVKIYAFNERGHRVPPRRGFALRDALIATKGNWSCGGLAVDMANVDGYDRIIVLTDGEWHQIRNHALHGGGPALTISPPPLTKRAYMLNVANTKNGVGYGKWTSIDGWSESVIAFIAASESMAD